MFNRLSSLRCARVFNAFSATHELLVERIKWLLVHDVICVSTFPASGRGDDVT
jgi:hypothetical protein